MSDSFFPAARRVLRNPIVKWSNRLIVASLTGLLTTVVWPNTSAWVSSRVDKATLEALDARLRIVERSREVDYVKLYQTGHDPGSLNDREQLQWALLRINALQAGLTRAARARLSIEVLLLYPNPRSDQARRMASTAKNKFDELIQRGDEPETAAHKALEYVYENF